MVADEPDRHDHDRIDPGAGEPPDFVVHVRFEPGDLGWARSTLPHEGVRWSRISDPIGDEAGGFGELRLVVGGRRHRNGDRVGGEHQRWSSVLTEFVDGGAGRLGEWLDEARMVVVGPNLVDVRDGQVGSTLRNLVARSDDVLAVLTTARVGRVGGREDGERTGHTVLGHPFDLVAEIGIPVAIAPVDGEAHACVGEGALKGGSLASALLVDGAHPAEVGVMLTDLGEPFARDATTAGDVLQEGDHVVGSFGSAETHEEDGVVGEIGHARTVGPSLAF